MSHDEGSKNIAALFQAENKFIMFREKQKEQGDYPLLIIFAPLLSV